MQYTLYELCWLFLFYSFVGWIIETVYAGFKKKRFINRGILNGPVCIIYGISAVIITVVLNDLTDNLLFLFLGSAIIATTTEWIVGHVLERINQQRWWDYSNKKWNLNGYVCLEYSVIWGISGMLGAKYLNGILIDGYHLIPQNIMHLIIWILMGLSVFDLVSSLAVILKITKGRTFFHEWNHQAVIITIRIGRWLVKHLGKRVTNAYPSAAIPATEKEHGKSTIFAKGCCFYKLFWLFLIGAFLGAVVEIIFCKITIGIWISRSSLVWGQFSIVWGLGIALITGLIYQYKDSSDRFLFLVGTFLGGAFEYLCSVFTELVFGTVFWDYSGIPFNLGGRINLLYCFFWGIAAVVWFKVLYPKISNLIEKLPKKSGTVITWLLIVFMIVNMFASTSALYRYSQRNVGISAGNTYEALIDEQFPDEKMNSIYPNAKMK